MRRIALVAASLLAAACATSSPPEYPHPLTGEVWGYFLVVQNEPTRRTVTYASDRPSCELSRAVGTTHTGLPVLGERSGRPAIVPT